MKQEKKVAWTLLPAVLFTLFFFACLNEGDTPSTVVALFIALSLFLATIILSKSKKEEIIKNTYKPLEYPISRAMAQTDGEFISKPLEYYDGQDDPEQEI